MNANEIQVLRFFRDLSNPFLDNVFRIVSLLGEQYFIIAVIFVIFFFIDKKIAYRVMYTIFLELCLNNTIKGIIQRPRPWVADATYEPAEIAKGTATGYSFPSGHTAIISTLATSISINFRKKLVIVICSVLVVLVAFSRIILGVHYPTDVLVGFLVGVGVAFLGHIIYRKVEDETNKQLLTYLVTLVLFAPFLFIFFTSDYDAMLWQKDFYVAWCMTLGAGLAILIESKCVQVEISKKFSINLIRFLGCVVVLAITYIGLKFFFKLPIFPQEGNSFKIIFDGIRYFAMCFNCLGLYPLIFRKVLFKKEQ